MKNYLPVLIHVLYFYRNKQGLVRTYIFNSLPHSHLAFLSEQGLGKSMNCDSRLAGKMHPVQSQLCCVLAPCFSLVKIENYGECLTCKKELYAVMFLDVFIKFKNILQKCRKCLAQPIYLLNLKQGKIMHDY